LAARDDVFQDVFLDVFRSLPGFRGKSKLSTWIASVTINTCRAHIRKINRDATFRSLDTWLEDEGDAVVSGHPRDQNLEKSETRSLLERHLDRLPPKY
jgi:RNA polymerase sigma factor (sigma-70 family)